MGEMRIFVSHSHKDEDFTQRLVNDLHQAGAEVWVDKTGITHGNFMQRIDEALAQCEWMVLVLTPNSIASEYVKEEVYTALNRVKQGHMHAVVPVLASECAPNSIPPLWDALHRYDAARDYNAALEGVLRALRLSPASVATPESTVVATAAPTSKSTSENQSQKQQARTMLAVENDQNIHALRDFWEHVTHLPAPEGSTDEAEFEKKLRLAQRYLQPMSHDRWRSLETVLAADLAYDEYQQTELLHRALDQFVDMRARIQGAFTTAEAQKLLQDYVEWKKVRRQMSVSQYSPQLSSELEDFNRRNFDYFNGCLEIRNTCRNPIRIEG